MSNVRVSRLGNNDMEIYLVGGAVRDELLGLPVKEKDYVVVGATIDDMLKLGYRQVGKDFPVFLHPKTKEEYALARMERKVGRGYTGFDFDASPSVTLEEDLLRRDLTINAIARNETTAKLIDPFHGQDDIQKKVLRHVSPAFVEDPVRILRVARFAARFASLSFQVAPETMQLMQEMVKSGEVDALVPERVWKECERALQEKQPTVFFQVLADSHALPSLFPEIKLDYLKTLSHAAKISADPEIRFAALMSQLNASELTSLCNRNRIPSAFKELAELTIKLRADYIRATDMDAEALLGFLQAADMFRRKERFVKLLMVCDAVTGNAVSAMLLAEVSQKIDEITYHDLPSMSGPEIGQQRNLQRLDVIKTFLNQK